MLRREAEAIAGSVHEGIETARGVAILSPPWLHSELCSVTAYDFCWFREAFWSEITLRCCQLKPAVSMRFPQLMAALTAGP